ncbi:hypothetical protein JYU34_016218 [Plutella xylostella]|uniref:Uncharacterized protein n=1 Tax=Plutella xylostella TaxID=51655 RepID=A0ABQ7Q2Y9_PLUXY|nr:hypothetical protein JYU34_016218 [Plutella xylostella]
MLVREFGQPSSVSRHAIFAYFSPVPAPARVVRRLEVGNVGMPARGSRPQFSRRYSETDPLISRANTDGDCGIITRYMN